MSEFAAVRGGKPKGFLNPASAFRVQETHRAVLLLEPAQLVGEVIDERYRIEEYLGSGAMGRVFRVRHVRIAHRQYALKLLDTSDTHASLERFEREARLAGRLGHPNTVSVVDFGMIGPVAFLVMELAPGVPLASLMRGAPFPRTRAVNLVGQLCDGLGHAHGRGVIHRDLKPENIIVESPGTTDEVARIVDFGIAISDDAIASPHSRLTRHDMVCGTPQYVAPEIARGLPFDHRSDLFALGVIFYELLCGKPPFDGDGVEMMSRNVFSDAPAMAARVPDLVIDPRLEALSRRLMAREPQDRPATATHARMLLDRLRG